MAGNFTINVVVTNAGGGGTGGGTGGGQGGGGDLTSSVVGATIGGAALRERGVVGPRQVAETFAERQANAHILTNQNRKALGWALYGLPTVGPGKGEFRVSATDWTDLTGEDGIPYSAYDKVYGSPYRKIRDKSFFRREAYRQDIKITTDLKDKFGTITDIDVMEFPSIQKFGTSGLTDLVDDAKRHFVTHQGRYKVLASAIGAKAISQSIAFYQHTSGDNLSNQQLSNAQRLAQYTGAVALSGPLAPWVIAGIAVTEISGLIGDVMRYDFNRKIERNEITNNMIAAGNASYGRMRGVGV